MTYVYRVKPEQNHNTDRRFRFLVLIFEVAFGKLSKIDLSLGPVFIGKLSKSICALTASGISSIGALS